MHELCSLAVSSFPWALYYRARQHGRSRLPCFDPNRRCSGTLIVPSIRRGSKALCVCCIVIGCWLAGRLIGTQRLEIHAFHLALPVVGAYSNVTILFCVTEDASNGSTSQRTIQLGLDVSSNDDSTRLLLREGRSRIEENGVETDCFMVRRYWFESK